MTEQLGHLLKQAHTRLTQERRKHKRGSSNWNDWNEHVRDINNVLSLLDLDEIRTLLDGE